MTLPIQFSAEADAELDHAASWYDERNPGLGDDFMDAVETAAATVADWPGSGALVEGTDSSLEVRRTPIGRFDYHLAYVVEDERIHVLAVAHDRRRPRYWAPRIDR